MAEPIRGAPPAVAAALERLKQDLASAAGANLAGLILYGGLARGRFRPGQSDVNVVVLLREATAEALAAIAPALRTARLAVGVEPMLLTPEEVPHAARAFPTKFLDVKEHHLVLAGEDPFARLEVTREHLRWRTEQELRNLLLRLRHNFITAGTQATALNRLLAELARPLALELSSLLRLAGKNVPEDDRSATIFAAAGEAFGFAAEPLGRLAALRHDGQQAGSPQALVGDVLDVLGKAVTLAERFRETPP